jgi:hypothetical protein
MMIIGRLWVRIAAIALAVLSTIVVGAFVAINDGKPGRQPGPPGRAEGSASARTPGDPYQAAPSQTAPQGTPPPPPTEVRASRRDDTVTLCWAESPGADAYVIYHSDATARGDWSRMPYPVPKPCWTGAMFNGGHAYEFRVRASNSHGESEPSEPARVEPSIELPDRPTMLTAAAGKGAVTLCWAESAGADAYVIYHHDTTTGGDWFRMPYPVAKPCWTGAQFTVGHKYEFRVRAANARGESEPSNVAPVTVGGG